ncbi:uncharacterized protein C8Q71DRAFT_354628 [Rhodofomes roseus]|uniref:Uncharacterized protein n=1 Tax=Rhodofomes roseus TaxID=34475 RepID=A0ABQ8KU34_9APHY|nr:uncharacterized protein C8Q71DRAFT_354628 [Rhodofomes roseus]KAH9841936.1 hypothetical protein C8Q71DRAFT_354628 [Rhodofomes roseus]
MSFNFNVFGAVTGGLGFLLAILQYLLFVTFRPSRVLRALEESLDSLQNVLVDVQRDGIPDDDFSLGWAGAQTRLDHYRTRTRMLRCEVNSLASVTSEINAIMCGLTCKLFSLRRKTYSLLAEVAVAELFERQRQEDHMLDNQFSVRVFGATAMSAAEAEHYEASVNTARPMYTVRNRRVASYASAEAIGGNIDPSNASLYYRTREAGCSSVMNSISSESATAGTLVTHRDLPCPYSS